MIETRSLWLEGATPERFPVLEGDVSADVAVLGAGIVGTVAAMLLQAEGSEVVLVDAARVGGGATGHTTAKLTSLQRVKYSRLRSRRGAEVASAYATANESGRREIERLARAHGIDCDYRQRPAYTYAEDSDQLAEIEAELEAAREAGLAVERVDEVPLPFSTAGGIRLAESAEFHPVKFLDGLADSLAAAGGRIFERTRAVGLHDGAPCKVETDTGRITAAKVIVATHFPFTDRALLFARMYPERSYSLAVEVDGDVPEGMFINADGPVRSIRAHPSGGEELLLVGGEGHKVGQGGSTQKRYARLEEFARANFGLRSVPYRWSTQDNVTADSAPYIGRLTPRSRNSFTATGFNKWGLAMGVSAAAMLTDAVLERENMLVEHFDPSRLPSVQALPELASENANVGFHFFADRLTRRARASLDALEPGEGKVVSSRGRQLAVSRDEDGELTAVSARCTHLACIVAWNDAERSWDCPCHGSRFAPDGSVLEGPAIRPLARKALPGG